MSEIVEKLEQTKNKKTSKPKTQKSPIDKKNATRKIYSFMKSKIPKIRARFLNHICSDSSVCIAFGKEVNIIKKHFDDYQHFHYIIEINKFGAKSANGFINKITFERDGYVSHAILKSAMKPNSDNLFYEYLVGNYINKLNKIYPCFLETYSYYTYNSPEVWEKLKNDEVVDLEKELVLQNYKKGDYEKFAMSCMELNYICILIQYIDNAKSLQAMLESKEFVKNDMIFVLYQIYMALSCVANSFTHYDLHLNNVLVYEPIQNKYIEYHYHTLDNETIVYKSKYITKIIDYGHSFFNDVTNSDYMTNSSQNIYDTICEEEQCEPLCGKYFGYTLLDPRRYSYFTHYLSSVRKNQSHDLRLLYIIFKVYIDYIGDLNKPLKTLLDKVVYCRGYPVGTKKCFGTMENTTEGLPYQIHNVNDAHNELLNLVKSTVSVNNERYDNMEKIGVLHVYYDRRPMKFEQSR